MSEGAVVGTDDGGLRSSLRLPDGRSIDVWQAGPPEGEPLVLHHGTPGAGLPFGQILDELVAGGG